MKLGLRARSSMGRTTSQPKRAQVQDAAPPVDWRGVQTQRAQYTPAANIFAQGDPATTILYVERGTVRLSVVSHTGKEAVVAIVMDDLGHG